MTCYDYTDYKCNCGSYLTHGYVLDIRNRIITIVEKFENYRPV